MRPAQAELAVPPGDGRMRAVAFAALAEACILALPAHLLLTEKLDAAVPELPFAIGFLAVFVAGTTSVYRFRGAPNAAVIAAVVSLLAALLVGGVNRNFLILRLVAAAVVAFRAISLGFRDWRYPLHGEIEWGALAMGAEAALGTATGFGAWRIPLAMMIPAFFAAALGSRAVTIWHDPGVDPADTRAWLGRIPMTFTAYVVAVIALAAAALRGGVLERLGSIVVPLASVILTIVLFVLLLVFSPIVWLVSRFHVNTDAWQRFLQSLGDGTSTAPRLEPPHGALGGSVFRILGLVLFSLLIWGIYRALRRLRAAAVPPSPRTDRAPVASTPLPHPVPPPPARRRSLPADQVRRWYAESLLALERQKIRKDPSLTPAEFALEVSQTLPELRDHLDPLTRAYEDVRYGNLKVDDVTIRELRSHHRALIATLRHLPDPGEPAAT